MINKNGRFSKQTEQRVLNIIEEYDYRPNELARGLRVDKAQVVGGIVPDITNEKLELEKQYIEMLKSMRVGGIIYISGDQQVNRVENIPAVYIDRQPAFVENKEGSSFIGSDNYQGAYMATKHLIEAGRKKIALVLHDKTIAT